MSSNWYPRVFHLALCLALTIPTSIARAATGEFGYSGGVLTCDSSAQPPDQQPPYLACLQIGPIQIGETLRTVSMKFGKARKTVKRGDVTERLYPIALNVPAGHPVPYWVIGFDRQRVISIQITGDLLVDQYAIGFDRQRVISIQITGDLLVDQYAFSSIRVGDPESRVLLLLGPPEFSQPVSQVGGDMWGYSPYPVTFEIKNGRVYSMRVSEEIGK
jgi:hypothetical protein